MPCDILRLRAVDQVIPARNFTSAYQSVYLYVKEG